MNQTGNWPRDDAHYQALLRPVTDVMDISRHLPELPFRTQMSNVDICQYSHAIEGSFEPVLQDLVDVHGDDSIILVTIDPTASDYHRLYGTYGAFSIPGPNVSESYWSAMAGESTGELIFTANTIAIAGSSRQWAVWGERTWDIAMIASNRSSGPWLSRGVPFVPPETALAEFTEPDYKNSLVESQRAKFLRNFQSENRREEDLSADPN